LSVLTQWQYLCTECKAPYCEKCTSVVALGEQVHDRPVRVCRNCVASIEEKIRMHKRAEAEALARQLGVSDCTAGGDAVLTAVQKQSVRLGSGRRRRGEESKRWVLRACALEF
jgi:hypothetical protein